MANTIGLMGVPSLCTLGRPYICGNPVLHLHCGVTSQGPVLVITEGLYHSVSIFGFVHYHGSSAFVSRNDDDVDVILQFLTHHNPLPLPLFIFIYSMFCF